MARQPKEKVRGITGFGVINNGVLIRTSGIRGAGLGLFTSRKYEKGDLITEYYGRHISHEKAHALRDQKLDSHIRVVTSFHEHIDGIKEPKAGFGGASFANDARSSKINNAVFVNKYDQTQALQRVFLKAKWDLPKSTEVFVGYGRTYWKLRDMPLTIISTPQPSAQQPMSSSAAQARDQSWGDQASAGCVSDVECVDLMISGEWQTKRHWLPRLCTMTVPSMLVWSQLLPFKRSTHVMMKTIDLGIPGEQASEPTEVRLGWKSPGHRIYVPLSAKAAEYAHRGIDSISLTKEGDLTIYVAPAQPSLENAHWCKQLALVKQLRLKRQQLQQEREQQQSQQQQQRPQQHQEHQGPLTRAQRERTQAAASSPHASTGSSKARTAAKPPPAGVGLSLRPKRLASVGVGLLSKALGPKQRNAAG